MPSTTAHPDWAQARHLLAARQWPQAAKLLAKITADQPGHMTAWLELSTALQELRDYRSAFDATQRAFAHREADAGLLFRLARQLRFFYDVPALLACLHEPAVRASGDVDSLAEMAATTSMLGELSLASEFTERAIRLAGADPSLLHRRASIEEYAGRFDEAAADLRRVIAAQPGHVHALYALSRLPARWQRDGDLVVIERALATTAAGSEAHALLSFAQFQLLDRTGDTTRAWDSLARANATMSALLRYRPESELEFMKALAALPLQALPAGAQVVAEPTPIFIVGLHRTGSSLLELQLAAHGSVASLGESFEFPAQLRWGCNTAFSGATHPVVLERFASLDLPELGRRYRAQVRARAPGARFVTEKLPMNFLNTGLILAALPDARIVHIRRNPMDVCFSNYKEVFRNVARYSYDLGQMARFYAGYRRLMECWQDRFPGRILEVEYEALARDPGATLARVRRHCGVPESAMGALEADAVPVVTASSMQVRGDVHTRFIGGWTRYARQLTPLRQALLDAGVDPGDDATIP